ncbi:MAG TPA: hypothetical protein VFK02_30625 [Kofleriaceae bacterium]|nr:hypothetical protein [Kofleriaceae bacterium]
MACDLRRNDARRDDVIDDFTAGRLAMLAREIRRRARHARRPGSRAEIAVETLRAIEPVVARYLAAERQRRHA